MTVVELRQYRLHTGRRDDLVALFDREFVEPQETNGLRVIGTFRDLDDPDRFVWFRGFPDMAARRAGLETFYDGPVWRAHKLAANATMIDSDDVLLLRPVVPFADASGPLTVVSVLALAEPAEDGLLSWFEANVEPLLAGAGSPLVALLVADPSPNSFPRLPVREGEQVLVRVSGFSGEAAFAKHRAALHGSVDWAAVSGELARRTRGSGQLLRLAPTPRSRLR
jgi:hypothetical protein